jgi:hypothetical protein
MARLHSRSCRDFGVGGAGQLLLTLTTLLLCGTSAVPVGAQDHSAVLQKSADRAQEEVTERERSKKDGARLRLFLDDTLLSPTFGARLALSATLDQAGREPEEWGRGADGFGKRLAARGGRALTQVAVQHATAAVMKIDPRGDRARCGCSHPLRRTAHALTKTFVVRDRRGRTVPNAPLFVGAYAGATIASAWYPPSYDASRNALRVAGATVAAQAGANLLREFAPELKRLVPGMARGQ